MAIGTRKSAVKAPAKVEPVAPPVAPVETTPVAKPVAAKAKSSPKTATIAAAPSKIEPPVAPKPEASVKPIAPKRVKAVAPKPTLVIEAPPTPPAPKVEAPAPTPVEPLPVAPVAALSVVVDEVATSYKAPVHPDMTAFGKANVEAIVHANQALARGVETLSREVISLTQASYGAAQAAAKALLGAKTLADVVELNTKFTQASFERFVGDTARLGELGAKIAKEALAPVASRMTQAVETVVRR